MTQNIASWSVQQPPLKAAATAAASWVRTEAPARAVGMHSLQTAKGHPLQARYWKYHCAATVLIYLAEFSTSFLHAGFLLCCVKVGWWGTWRRERDSKNFSSPWVISFLVVLSILNARSFSEFILYLLRSLTQFCFCFFCGLIFNTIKM